MEEKGDALDMCNVETIDAKRHRGTRAGGEFIGGKPSNHKVYCNCVATPELCGRRAGDERQLN